MNVRYRVELLKVPLIFSGNGGNKRIMDVEVFLRKESETADQMEISV
jgi:hypothetical protein